MISRASTKIVLHVETSPDDGAPSAIVHHGRRLMVRGIIDQWGGTGHFYVKLVADDGNLYIIRHDLEENAWEMVLMVASATGERNRPLTSG